MMSESDRADIEMMFELADQIQLWPIILSEYERFGFSDQISDQTKFDEFNYVIDQLSKFVYSKRTCVLSCKSAEQMLRQARMLQPRDRTRAKTRQELVYRSLRDEWIRQLSNSIETYLDEEE